MPNNPAPDLFRAAHGSGWHPCFFCGAPVATECSYGSPYGTPPCPWFVVHHFDEDRSNNEPGNLVAAHFGCHQRHHQLKRIALNPEKYSPPTATPGQGTGRALSVEHRANIGAGLRTRKRTALEQEQHSERSRKTMLRYWAEGHEEQREALRQNNRRRARANT